MRFRDLLDDLIWDWLASHGCAPSNAEFDRLVDEIIAAQAKASKAHTPLQQPGDFVDEWGQGLIRVRKGPA